MMQFIGSAWYGKSSHGGGSNDRTGVVIIISQGVSSSAALLDTYDCFMYIIVVLELQHGMVRKIVLV